ncbi:hypothetical protein FQA39_LY07263 [Lamprigera yunnana]|nr:hypothetical protein FQA39_LY07263 [Lamprigera yunnana]
MNDNIVSGPNEPYEVQFESFGKYLFSCLKKRKPEDILAIDGVEGKIFTCGEALSQSIRLCEALRQLTISKGDVCNVCLRKCDRYLRALPCFVAPNMIVDELSHVVRISKPKVVICRKSSLDIIRTLQKEHKSIQTVILMDKDYENTDLLDIKTLVESATVNEDDFEPVCLNIDDTVFLLMSSGTSGLPKCTELSNRSLIFSANCIKDKNGYNMLACDTTILVVPLYHIYGALLYMGAIITSAKLILLKSFKPQLFLQCVQNYKVSKLYIVPTLMDFLATSAVVNDFDISSVKEIIFGGSSLRDDLYKKAVKKFNWVTIREGYGCTEVCGPTTFQRPTDGFRSVGVLSRNHYAKVVDAKTNKSLGPLEAGEICIKSKTMMKGYYNDPIETTKAIDSDGFYHTGDVGYYNKDGYFFIVGRIKDIIKCKGFQVSPLELENIIITHPSVLECVVVGKNDEKTQQVPMAFVVRRPNCSLTENEIDGVEGNIFTCGEALSQSIRLCEALRQLRISKGDVVMFVCENTTDTYVPYLAMLYIGAVINMVSSRYLLDELSHVVRISKPKVVICPKSSLDNIRTLEKEHKSIETVILMDKDYENTDVLDIKTLVESAKVNEDGFEPVCLNVDDTVFLLMSSGTSGLPKCAELSNQSIIFPTNCIKDKNGYNMLACDTTILVVPLYHIYGAVLYMGAIITSAKLILLKSFKPQLFLRCVQNYKVSKLYIVPTLLDFLATSAVVNDFDISSVKEIFFGSSSLRDDLYKKAVKKFSWVTIREGYGCTEICGPVTFQRSTDRFRSVGVLSRNHHAKVVDAKTNKSLGPLNVGEICIKSKTMMKGYYNDPVETTKAIDSDGFYHTGDVGYYNKDGHFFVVGRITDIIKCKGFQVSPLELENIIITHPSVLECVVVGKNDEKAQQVPMAFVVRRPNCSLTENEVVDFVSVVTLKMNDNIVSGPNEPYEVQFESLGKYLFSCLKKRKSDDILAIDGVEGKILTCGEALSQSIRLCEALRQLRISKGDVVMFVCENTTDTYVPYLALLYIGAVINMVSSRYLLDELSHVVRISKPKVVICPKSSLDIIRTLQKEHKSIQTVILMDKDYENTDVLDIKTLVESATVNEDVFEPVRLNVDDTVLLLMSSGTSGLPKCTELSNRSLIFIVNCIIDKNSLNMLACDTTILVLPLYHIFGAGVYMGAIITSAKVILLKSFHPGLFLQSVQNYRVSKLYIVPTIVDFLATSALVNDFDVSSVREIIFGGSSLRDDQYKKVVEKFSWVTIREGYGCTEACGVVTIQRSADRFRSVGVLSRNHHIKVVDAKTNKSLGPLDVGEICIKSKTMMKGYYNDPIETTKAIDSDGFYHTGDVGYYNNDGHFFIVDRIKDIIKCKGFQVSPLELENIIITHPSVLECVVIGKNDEKAQQVPMAFVVRRPNCSLTENEVVDFVSERISPQKRLYGGVKFIDEIPKTPSGKILRKELIDF